MLAARFVLLAALWFLVGQTRDAAAQAVPSEPAPDPEPAEYRALIAGALAEYDAGHFDESRTLMLRAHATYPNARTLRGLGMVSFELRLYAESVEHLEEALASTARPLEGSLREQTADLLERARSFTGRLTLEVTPSTAHVLIDGVEAAPSSRSALVLTVGNHALEAQAENYQLERRSVRIVGGEVQLVQLALTPLSQTAAPKEKPKRRVWYKNPWLWISAGAVVVAGAASATTLMLTRDDNPRAPPYRGLSGEPPLVGPSQ